MPPANTPAERTPQEAVSPAMQRTSSPASYLPAFQSLTSPVLDLASTLTIHNHTEDDVDAENVAFLRNTFDMPDSAPSILPRPLHEERRTREAHSWLRSASEEARERRFHEGRLEQLRQRQDSLQAWSDRTIHRTRSAYGEGAPNHQSLFDWAPARDAEGEELENILTELTRQQPNTHPEILRVQARARVDSNRELRNRPSLRPQVQGHGTSSHEPPASLRSAAILQSFRRNHRILTRSREYLNRLNTADREPTNTQERTSSWGMDRRDHSDPNRRHRTDTSTAAQVGNGGSSRYELNRLAWQASQPITESRSPHGENVEALRRRYLENPSASSKTSEFERIIKYLHVLRSPDGISQRSVDQFERFQPPDKRHSWDNTDHLKIHATRPPRPPPTSWLSPGSCFTGTQQATPMTSSGATMYRLVQSQPRHGASDAPAVIDHQDNRTSSSDSAIPPWLRHLTTSELLSLFSPPCPATSGSPIQDHWTVKVAVHNVDYETMTLQGTMEAFNVPSYPSYSTTNPSGTTGTTTTSNTAGVNASKTTFSTYLEGELIDLSTHTLLTESDALGVKTTPDIDAAYWRRLEPFAKLTDDEIARALLDRRWIEEQLMGRYVLMRWKERCFVKPTLTSSEPSSPQSPASHSANSTTSTPSTLGQAQQRRQQRQTPAQLPPNRDSTTSFLSGTDGNGYGLSISGFYYVSLRRSDGRLEGLYFDPQSSPYQHLEMNPRPGGWGSAAWEFR